ncbi:MAG: hypothetical protein JXM70_24085, partial [Pirellulales bacterium]|nr:hypothetical protein [Pirellulales bacterium]
VDKDTKKPIACRMHLSRADGRPKKIKGVPNWDDHFVFPGQITLKLPKGGYKFELERGPEYVTRSGHFMIEHFADDAKEVDLQRFVDMAAYGWYSGDLHARRAPRDIELLMLAEDLHVVPVAIWWNDKVLLGGTIPGEKKQDEETLVHFDGNRFYSLAAGGFTWPGGEILCFNLPQPLQKMFLRSKSEREFPSPLGLFQKAHVDTEELDGTETQGGSPVWIDITRPYWWDVPMLVAMGQIDSIQIAHGNICRGKTINNEQGGKSRNKTLYPGVRGNAQWSEDIYFNLLECGIRIPPSAGSGSGISPNPLGYNRMYVHVEGPFGYEKWWQAFAAGRVTITNGPLLRPSVYGKLPGHVFYYQQGTTPDFEIGLTLSTRKPISYIEIIKNGQLAKSIPFDEYRKAHGLPKLRFDNSGWFLVRAVTDLPETYRFAMTAPYYVQIGEQPRISRRAVQFFIDWTYERAGQIRKIEDPVERSSVMQAHRQARDFWQALLSKANAD